MEISVLVAVLLVLGTAFFGYESITHMDRLETRLRSPCTYTMNHVSKHWARLWRVAPRWFYILATIAIAGCLNPN
jgi:hypothetical protein